jgi:hypothetical protein
MVVLRCALVADLTVSWDLPPPTMFSLNSKFRRFLFFLLLLLVLNSVSTCSSIHD